MPSVERVSLPLSMPRTNSTHEGNAPTTSPHREEVKPAERRDDTHPFTREELKLFLDTAHQHFPRSVPFFLTLARTGLRLGEALALQWGDIDWHGRFLEVRRTFCHRSRQMQTPKSGKSRRVDMSQQLTTTLKALLVERKKETLRNGWNELPPSIFITDEGTMVDGDNMRHRIFYPILKKAGLRQVRLHDLRHTFASLLIQQGAPLLYVKEQMGHHSIQVTADIYGHLVPGGNRAEVDRLDDPDEHTPEATIRNPAATTTTDSVLSDRLSA